MTVHLGELLPLVAAGHEPAQEVAEHVDRCDECHLALVTMSPLALEYVWAGVRAEVAAPAAKPLARVLEMMGLEPSLARFAGATPAVRPAWLAANLALIGLVAAYSGVAASALGGVAPILLIAPVIGVVAVAFSYGPVLDPAYEIVTSTPLSPVTALLVRLSVVLGSSALLIGSAVSVWAIVTGRGGLVLASWVVPMAAVSLLGAVVASRSLPWIGAVIGSATWLVLVLVATSVAPDPASLLLGPISQLAGGVGALVLLWVLVRQAHAGRCPVRARVA